MNIKLEINNVEKDVKIKGIKQSHRDDYFKKIISMENVEDDKEISNEDKLNKTQEVINWLQNLGLRKSDLSEEEKKDLDLEELDKITQAVREILQPLSEKKN